MPLCHGYAVDWEREDDKLCKSPDIHLPGGEQRSRLLSFSSGELPRSSGLRNTEVGEEENFLYPCRYLWMA